ncbi:MAG: M48 family metalloprotease [Thermoanaerobaculia bacterium]|nr:M48 family metalloprotease [Thermoanaerobaculia bacterium]
MALDPFALPPETLGRFLLLVVAALIAAWSLPSYFLEVPLFVDHLNRIPDDVVELTQKAAVEGFSSLDGDDKRRLYEWAAEHPLFGEAHRRQVLRSLASLGVVLGLAVVAMFLAWFRRPPFVPLLARQVPEIHGEVTHLARRLGIVPPPGLAVGGGFLDGKAFCGRQGAIIALGGEPRWLARCWNDLWRSVLLHELGHVVNRDSRVREIARWLWIVFAFSLTVALLLLISQGKLSAAASMVTRNAVLFVAAWWLWAGLVRERELYADQRVVTWGYGSALARRLSLPQSHGWRPDDVGESGAWLDRIRRWSSGARHPSNLDRLKALDRPQQFFRLSPRLALLTGLVLALPIANAGPLLHDLLLPAGLLAAPMFLLPMGHLVILPSLVVLVSLFMMTIAFGISGSLGLQTLRSALAERWRGVGSHRGIEKLILPAFCFAGGLQVGLVPWTGWPVSALSVLATLVLWTALGWSWLAVTWSSGRWVLGACTGSRPPRVLIGLSRWIGVAVLVLLAWPVVAHRALTTAAARAGISGLPSDVRVSIEVLLALLAGSGLVCVIVVCFVVLPAFLRSRKVACELCGRAASRRSGIEAHCLNCSTPLASWLCLVPVDVWLGFRVEDSRSPQGGTRT